jgi:hypothetical protein
VVPGEVAGAEDVVAADRFHHVAGVDAFAVHGRLDGQAGRGRVEAVVAGADSGEEVDEGVAASVVGTNLHAQKRKTSAAEKRRRRMHSRSAPIVQSGLNRAIRR